MLQIALCAVTLGFSQDSRTPVTAQDPPAQTPAAPPAPPVFENTGKPISIPFQCTEDDLQWAGLTCSVEDPCPIYLELTAAEGAGNRILAGGNFHTSRATLRSVLLASEDGGHTWREAHEQIRGAALDHIQIFDAEHAWVSGQIMVPLPQEPFLLVSTDDTKTWRQRAVLSEASESRLGTIQQFFFTDPKSGSLILDRGAGSSDRYELYESPDGETWNIKETSTKPLTLRRAPPASEWRVRVDGPSQSFHVENRRAERWTSVGSFQVKAGVCKPE